MERERGVEGLECEALVAAENKMKCSAKMIP
jgi:hypothetical protein